MLPLVMALLAAQAPAVKLDFTSFRGLSVEVQGVPIIQGSSFQYFEQGSKKGIYSSVWRPQRVERLPNGGIRARFNSGDGRILGNQLFQYTPKGVRATYEFRWRGTKPVLVENSAALLWASAFRDGQVSIDGAPAVRLAQNARPTWDVAARSFGLPGSGFEFDTPMARVRARATPGNAVLFDARQLPREWAEGRDLLWLGYREQRLAPDQTLSYTIEWEFEPKPSVAPVRTSAELSAREQSVMQAATRDSEGVPLLPKPKSMRKQEGSFLTIGQKFDYALDPKHRQFAREFERTLGRLWIAQPENLAAGATHIEARVGDAKLPKEGYSLVVSPKGVELVGQDEGGLRNGFRTLALLARPSAGMLSFPICEIRDWPSVGWRGVHLFVGPRALEFQSHLMDRVLGPLKLNRVVLQCERTGWNATPGIETAITMPREDLALLFDRYRSCGFEPIPLIQSFGHMEWLFANGSNLNLALNQNDRYSVDPRKAATRDMLSAIWSEAIELLEPKTVHFGLDEFDKRGMPEDASYTTRLWARHVPWLLNLARNKKVNPMLWGDMMLAPGEAKDATHGHTRTHAKHRRAVLGRGVTVADWHYVDNPDSGAFPSLNLWLQSGVRPIAAYWYRAGNIRGQSIAAAKAGAGTLLTTWAGYESSEANMVRELRQFTAIVTAADYAWSARTEMPKGLPYDASEVFRRLYSDTPSPVGAAPGIQIVVGAPLRKETIGPVAFSVFAPVCLRTPLARDAAGAPNEVALPVNLKAREVALAVDCRAWVDDAEPVAEVEVELASGRKVTETLLYGAHLRSYADLRPTALTPRSGALSAVRARLGETPERVVRVAVRNLNPNAGLRLHGITAF